jgi:hypothetical protein
MTGSSEHESEPSDSKESREILNSLNIYNLASQEGLHCWRSIVDFTVGKENMD